MRYVISTGSIREPINVAIKSSALSRTAEKILFIRKRKTSNELSLSMELSLSYAFLGASCALPASLLALISRSTFDSAVSGLKNAA